MSHALQKPEAHVQSEERLTKIADAAARWAERSRAGMPVQARSELAFDDGKHPGLTVSHIPSWSMVASAEHLDFATRSMIAAETIWPTA